MIYNLEYKEFWFFFFENLYHNCSTSPAVCINSRQRYNRVASAFVGPAAERTWLMSFLLFWQVLIVCAAQRRCFQLPRNARQYWNIYLSCVVRGCKPCLSWVVAVPSDVYIAGVDDDRGRFWKVSDARSDAIHLITLLRWRRTYRAVVSTPLSRQGNDGVLELAMNFIKRTANLHERHAVRLFGLHWNTTKKVDLYLFLNPRKVLIPCKRTLRNKRQLFIASCSSSPTPGFVIIITLMAPVLSIIRDLLLGGVSLLQFPHRECRRRPAAGETNSLRSFGSVQ